VKFSKVLNKYKTMTILEKLRAHVVVLATTVTGIGTIIGSAFIVDSRYAHADQVKQNQTEQVQMIQQLQQSSQIQFEQVQLMSIDDKIFYLEQKETLTPSDQAQLNRFYRNRDDIIKRIDNLSFPRTQ